MSAAAKGAVVPVRSISMEELERSSGVGARTLRHWIKKGVLLRPNGLGRAARYTERHVLHARVIHHLRQSQRSLHRIRNRMAGLSDAQLQALLPPPRAITADDALPPPPPAPRYPATAWEIVQLMDGLALMVSTQRGPALRRVANDIYEHYALRPLL